jgi:hypothetical protein
VKLTICAPQQIGIVGLFLRSRNRAIPNHNPNYRIPALLRLIEKEAL